MVNRSSLTAGADRSQMHTEATALMHVLYKIPMYARRFTVPVDQVWHEFRLDRAVLNELVDLGLPHIRDDGDVLFDWHDLTNVVLHLPVHSPQRGAMRFWAKVLNRPPNAEAHYEVTYRPHCPVPGHQGPCEFRLRLPDDAETVQIGADPQHPPALPVGVDLHDDWPELDDGLVRLVDQYAGIHLIRLPEAIRWDCSFVEATGIGDCGGIAQLLSQQAERDGRETRMRLGLIVAPPYSMQHFWTEVRIEGRWTPIDPGLISAMVRWRILPPDVWSPCRSPGRLLVGFTSQLTRSATHGGFSAPVSFPTRLLVDRAGPSPTQAPPPSTHRKAAHS